jgi:hypothetical protein
MVPTLYFDANSYFGVFEDSGSTAYPVLKAMVAREQLTVVVSELTLTESLSGNHLPTFKPGFERLLALSPNWVFLSDLAIREVVAEDATLRGSVKPSPLVPLLSWSELLPLISTQDERASITPDFAIPTPESLLEFCEPGAAKDRLKNHWTPELDQLREGYRQIYAQAGSTQNFFARVTAHAVVRSVKDSNELAKLLWGNPDCAPAHRLKIELTCHKLNIREARWTTNDFLDHTHAGVIAC